MENHFFSSSSSVASVKAFNWMKIEIIIKKEPDHRIESSSNLKTLTSILVIGVSFRLIVFTQRKEKQIYNDWYQKSCRMNRARYSCMTVDHSKMSQIVTSRSLENDSSSISTNQLKIISLLRKSWENSSVV